MVRGHKLFAVNSEFFHYEKGKKLTLEEGALFSPNFPTNLPSPEKNASLCPF